MEATTILSAVLAASETAFKLKLYGGLAGVLAVMVGLVLVIFAAQRARARRLDREADARYARWKRRVEASGGALGELSVPLRLEAGEVAYFAANSAVLIEPQAVKVSSFTGLSADVNQHGEIFGGTARSTSHDEWRKVCDGALYVTNKHIIFNGQTSTRRIPVDDLMSFENESRTAVMSCKSAKKPLGFTNIDAKIFAAVVESVCGASQS